MARVIIKKGDIFSVAVSELTRRYFQYVANDLTQLNSDVIRVFKREYPVAAPPELSEVIRDEVAFYAHCVTKWGVKMGLWEKVGNSKELGSVDVYFRGTNDAGHKVGEERIRISQNWYVWKINDENFTRVGKLSGKYVVSEIGDVINPLSIVHRIKTGEYDFVYPGF